jgi:hypothetical protein
MITADRLKELLYYDSYTGIFTRKLRTGRTVHIGDIAGGIGSDGYISISIDNERYRAHRLAWLYSYGHWPINQIDHINGKRDDNRIDNLRDVSALGNARNQTIPKSGSTTGYIGVFKKRNKFIACIGMNYKKIHIGTFSTAEEASEAYQSYKQKLHTI